LDNHSLLRSLPVIGAKFGVVELNSLVDPHVLIFTFLSLFRHSKLFVHITHFRIAFVRVKSAYRLLDSPS